MYNLTVATYYEKGCGGDYTKVVIEMDGDVLREYGDYYHEKGREKAEAYLDAFFDLFGQAEVKVRYQDREDSE